jgi:cyclic pyranopterin phosphate synthase
MNEKKVKMVDVTEKKKTHRTSVSSGLISMTSPTLEIVKKGKVDKGDVIAVAHVAAITGAKLTPTIIPLCHPLNITGVDVRFEFEDDPPAVRVITEVKGYDRTGYEMEAMTATMAALLTIYDMLKPVDDSMVIGPVLLESKSGGKSGKWHRDK